MILILCIPVCIMFYVFGYNKGKSSEGYFLTGIANMLGEFKLIKQHARNIKQNHPEECGADFILNGCNAMLDYKGISNYIPEYHGKVNKE